jgi:uncharacterized coiled-coil protein SlyX
MAEIMQHTKIEVTATMLFTEVELRALDALVGYGVEPFLKVFYEKMGKHYMQPHEAGLRSLFESVSKFVPGILRRTNDAKRVFTGERIAVQSDMPDRLGKAGAQIAELNAQLGEAQAELESLTEKLAAHHAATAKLEGQLSEARADKAPAQEPGEQKEGE